MNTQSNESSATGERNPRCPRITLEDAVERLSKLQKAIGKSTVDSGSASKAIGYSSPSGAALSTLGYMSMYGLVTRVAGKISVSELGRRVLFPVTTDINGEAAKKEAALTPKMFKRINGEFDDLEVVVLGSQLIHLGFDEDAAKNAAKVYKANKAFAKLDGSEKVTLDNGGKGGDIEGSEQGNQTPPPNMTNPQGVQSLPVPLGNGLVAYVPYPMTGAAFDMLKGALDLFKPMIVSPAGQHPSPTQPKLPDPSAHPMAGQSKGT